MISLLRNSVGRASLSLTVLGCSALLAPKAVAQFQMDPARRIEITVPVKEAGTVDVLTGRWTQPGASTKSAPVVVFNNTCNWAPASYYAAFSECEDSYDEGRVPEPNSPGTHVGAAASQQILQIDLSYCTYNATPGGGMNMEFAFWNKLNGNCIGGIPVNHSNTSGGATWTTLANFYLDTSGLGLPGSTANGIQACWLVNLDVSGLGWTLASEGEGTFDNFDAEDKFIWGKRINDKSPGGSAKPNGFLLAGDPNFSARGSCTYTNPCSGGLTGPCGTGLGAWDGSWINVDNVGVGSSALPPAPCLPGIAAYGYGSNCYWFGGYPTNVFDSYYLRLVGDPLGSPGKFCTSKASSLPNCAPSLTGSGPNVSKSAGSYTVTAAPVPGGAAKPGILIFTNHGPSAPILTNFGFLCVGQFQRAGNFPASPGGTNGLCNGAYNWPLQSIVASTAFLLPGDKIHVQGWYRDNGFAPPFNANFTHGIGPITVLP